MEVNFSSKMKWILNFWSLEIQWEMEDNGENKSIQIKHNKVGEAQP